MIEYEFLLNNNTEKVRSLILMIIDSFFMQKKLRYISKMIGFGEEALDIFLKVGNDVNKLEEDLFLYNLVVEKLAQLSKNANLVSKKLKEEGSDINWEKHIEISDLYVKGAINNRMLNDYLQKEVPELLNCLYQLINSKCKTIRYRSYFHDSTIYNVPVEHYAPYPILEKIYENSKNSLDSIETKHKKYSKIIKRYKQKSKDINRQIRINNINGKQNIANYVIGLKKLLDETEISNNIIVNRKIEGKELEYIKSCHNEFENNGKAKTFSKVDFCSTFSKPFLTKSILSKKSKGYLMILLPEKSNAMYLDFLKGACWGSEKEILLQMNSKFEFVEDNIFKHKNVFVVKLVT